MSAYEAIVIYRQNGDTQSKQSKRIDMMKPETRDTVTTTEGSRDTTEYSSG